MLQLGRAESVATQRGSAVLQAGIRFAFVITVKVYRSRSRVTSSFAKPLHLAAGRGPLVSAALALVVGCCSSVRAVEVSVTVVEGRTFVAEVDGRSDDRLLWLRFENGRTTIRRSIAWSKVAAVREGATPSTVARLRDLAMHARAAERATPTISPGATATPSAKGSLRTWRVPVDPTAAAAAKAATVRSLQIDASPANWDADVEVDGVMLGFAALDEYGAPVAVGGTLEVELIAERLPPYSRGNAFPVLARWTRAVVVEETEQSGGYGRARLEFQAQHPEYELSLPRFALVHARLSVPGQGVFEASLDGLSLRGFTPVRDRLEAASGTRLFSSEKTGRGHRESGRVVP
jgi:hypothetical protein